MKSIMTYETLDNFAYSNDKLLKGKIKGLAVDFMGLGNQLMVGDDNPEALGKVCRGERMAEAGIMYVLPYNNPWNWMNDQALRYTEEVIAVLSRKYSLPGDVPTVAMGGSMGGLCALVYTRYAKNTPVACVVNCPVCDLPFHFTERGDLPRTLYSAMWYAGEEDMDSALKARSPLHLAPDMPRAKYTVFHCTADKAVNIHSHSERFVSDMRRLGHDITFIKVPDRGHCDLGDEAQEMYERAIVSALG